MFRAAAAPSVAHRCNRHADSLFCVHVRTSVAHRSCTLTRSAHIPWLSPPRRCWSSDTAGRTSCQRECRLWRPGTSSAIPARQPMARQRRLASSDSSSDGAVSCGSSPSGRPDLPPCPHHTHSLSHPLSPPGRVCIAAPARSRPSAAPGCRCRVSCRRRQSRSSSRWRPACWRRTGRSRRRTRLATHSSPPCTLCVTGAHSPQRARTWPTLPRPVNTTYCCR